MPVVKLIDPEQLPGGVNSYGNHAVQEAVENLRQALRHNKALHLTPGPYERTAPVAANYRKAAKQLGIGISVRQVGTREYRMLNGEPGNEATQLYICITKAKTAPPTPPTPPRPRTVDTAAKPPIVTAHAGYEASAVVPGLEVSR